MFSGNRLGWRWIVIVLFLAVGGFLLFRSGIVTGPGNQPVLADALGERGAFADYNVLLITLDTTRADRLGCYGYKAIQTPTLDRLAAEGVLFSQTAAVAPVTLPAHASIFTGLYPRQHGARSNGFFNLGPEHVTLAEVMREAGYQTGAVIAAFVLNSRFGLAQGFDYYDDDLGKSGKSDPLLYAERNATEVTDSALAWLQETTGDPFLLWVHYFDPHSGYSPPSPFAERYANSPYDGEIAYMDNELGRLLEGLQQSGYGQNTIIVAIGDHGESLHQHGEATHGYLLYEETMRVPFIMHCGQSLGGGIELPASVSQVDVMPTLLALLGIDAPGGLDGIDLGRDQSTQRTFYGETYHGQMEHGWAALFAVYEDDYKYIYGADPELYNLADDPQELDNIHDRQTERAATLYGKLADWFGDELESSVPLSPSKQLTEEERQRLASLGYVFSNPTGSPQTSTLRDPKQMMGVLNEMNRVVFGRPPQERGPEVISELEEIIRQNPDFVPGYRYLGILKRGNNDLEGAITAFSRAVELHPGSPDLLLMLAETRSLHGQTGQAVDDLRQLLGAFPQDPKAHLILGRLLLAGEKPDSALTHLRLALELQPDLPGCADTLEKAYSRAGRMQELQQILDNALLGDPTSTQVRIAQASYLFRLNKFTEAENVLREGLRLTPDNPDAVNNLCKFLLFRTDGQGHNLAEAMKLFEGLSQEIVHSDPDILLTLSQIHGMNGKLNEALTACRESLELAGRNRQHAVATRARTYLDRLEQARAAGR